MSPIRFIFALILMIRMTSAEENVCASRGKAGCVMTPEQTEGPYFIEATQFRKDVREGRPGTQLDLTLVFQDTKTCAPIENLHIHIWNTDARGEYSGFQRLMTRARNPPIDGTRYMRGTQKTDCNGQVEFITILPGWYPGRTVHVHVEAFGGSQSSVKGLHTTQLYFSESITVEAETTNDAYKGNPNTRLKNTNDGIFSRGGTTLLLNTEYKNGKDISGGLKARYVLSITSGTATTGGRDATTTSTHTSTGLAMLAAAGSATTTTHLKIRHISLALCLGIVVGVINSSY